MTAPLVERLQAAADHPSHFSDSQHAELHAEAIKALPTTDPIEWWVICAEDGAAVRYSTKSQAITRCDQWNESPAPGTYVVHAVTLTPIYPEPKP